MKPSSRIPDVTAIRISPWPYVLSGNFVKFPSGSTERRQVLYSWWLKQMKISALLRWAQPPLSILNSRVPTLFNLHSLTTEICLLCKLPPNMNIFPCHTIEQDGQGEVSTSKLNLICLDFPLPSSISALLEISDLPRTKIHGAKQNVPFPVKPLSQEQLKLPIAFVQFAFWWQSWLPVSHSFKSEHVVPSQE